VSAAPPPLAAADAAAYFVMPKNVLNSSVQLAYHKLELL